MLIEKGRVYGLTCADCGAELAPRHLSRYKKCKNHFCNNKCRGHFRTGDKHPNYKKETTHPRIVTVNGKRRFLYQIEAEKYMKRLLEEDEVVYSIDGNPFNTTKKNMMVFASNAEMMAYMHGNPTASPVWSGRSKKDCKVGAYTPAKAPVYKLVMCPPGYESMANNIGYCLEHRLVVALHIGRPLTNRKVVHHIDGNSLNNDITNLMLFACGGDHTRFHMGLEVEILFDGSKI